MTGIDKNGVHVKTYEEIVESLEQKFKAIVGETFDTTPESPDGMNIRIFAKYIYDQYILAEAAYHSYNPAVATGIGLDNLVRLNGISRIENDPTRVTVSFNAVESVGTLIPMGTIVATEEDDIEFITKYDVVVPGETQAVCTQLGAIIIIPNEVTVLKGNFPDDVTCTNPEGGITGIVREEDPALRRRRERITAKFGASTMEAIYANVTDLNLEFIRVIENDTDATVDGIPPHSFLTVAEGSSIQEIAERIFQCKTIGIKAYGAEIATVYDSQGYAHSIGVSRPTKVNIWTKVKVIRPENVAISGLDDIQQAMVDHINSIQISEDVIWANLFVPATTAAPEITVKSVEVSTDGVTWTMQDVVIDNLSRAFTVLENNIVEEIVTP